VVSTLLELATQFLGIAMRRLLTWTPRTTEVELLKDVDKSNTAAALWAERKWNTEWQKILLTSAHFFLPIATENDLPGLD